MGNLTTYGANALLNGIAMPATLHAKLHLGNPSVTGTLNPGATTIRDSFTRSAASAGSTSNAVALEWTAAATETFTHITLWDHASAGNPWWIVPLTAPAIGSSGQPVNVVIAGLVLAFTRWA